MVKQPVSNPIIAMQGRVPGLFINQSAGYAGANVSVVIRGQNSINPLPGSSSPLYIVDGVPFGSDPVERSIGGFSPSFNFSPLNTINPADIESIDVLKDADATAIYGSRGANGVILITTKKGSSNGTDFTVDFSQGFGAASNLVEMLGTKEYLDIRRQAFANDNITPTAANAPDLTVWDQNAYTNFPKLLIGNTAHQTNAGVSVSGGNMYTQFTLGGTYRRESTVYHSATDDKATQLRLSVQHKSVDSKFSTAASISYNTDNNRIPSYNLNLTNYGLPPNYPLYTGDGNLYWGPGYDNPLAAFNSSISLKSSNLNATAVMRYSILPGLDIKANGGYNLIDVKGMIISPSRASNPAYNSPSLVTMNNNYIRTYLAEPQLTYQLSAGKSNLKLIAGGTWQRTETVQPYWLLGTYTNEKLVSSLGATNVLAKASDYADFRYTSVFSRAEYNWNEKYLISANIRRDGSSKFGANYRFGTFGSAAMGWIFSKEDFVSENLPWLSFGKLRASYGTIGNDKIRDYSYQSNYQAGATYGPLVTLGPDRIANPYLKWEQTKKFDLALDLGFLRDKILFTAIYYRNRTTDLLGEVPLPGQTGKDFYTANLDAIVQNQGLELELNTVNMDNGKFKWISSFNLTIPENKLVSYPGLMISTYNNRYVVGESLNLRTVFQSGGIVDGIATVVDVNGDGVITNGVNANGKGDFIVYGSNDPKYYGGLNNTFTYKGFQLDVFLQGTNRTATRGDLNFGAYPGTGYNLPKSMVNTGLLYSSTTSSDAGSKYYYFANSDASVESAAYVRLRNVSLAYNVPVTFSKKIGISSLQIYARGQNLLTFTGYKGIDPETLTNQVPPLKMFTAGFRTTF
ncbi:outer membrane receptor; ragA protein [Pedobacter sp. BAL39]|nr:outer membrane receptor; ragA protein [Pedobacter sp. BAL39]